MHFVLLLLGTVHGQLLIISGKVTAHVNVQILSFGTDSSFTVGVS